MSDARAQALRVLHRGRTVPNTIVWFGDSITFNGGRNDYTAAHSASGFWCWAQFLLGHLFAFVKNLGVTGEQTVTMRNRILDVVSLNPGWCHLLAGTNDVTHSIGYGQIIQNLDYMIGVLEGAGIRVLLGTIPPNNNLTAAQRLVLVQVNQWIREQSRVRRNVVVVDYHAATVDQLGGNYVSTAQQKHTVDGTHPSTVGAYAMGTALATAVQRAGVTGGWAVPADDADPSNVMLYACMTAGGSGASPTGWNASAVSNSGTVAFSKTPRTDLLGRNWQTVTITPTTAGASAAMTLTNPNSRSGAWAVGDTVVGVMEVNLTGLDQAPATDYQTGLSLGVRFTGASGGADDLQWANGVTSYYNHPVISRTGLLRTPPIVVPVGATGVQLVLTLGGGGTYNFGRGGVLNTNRYGIAA